MTPSPGGLWVDVGPGWFVGFTQVSLYGGILPRLYGPHVRAIGERWEVPRLHILSLGSSDVRHV